MNRRKPYLYRHGGKWRVTRATMAGKTWQVRRTLCGWNRAAIMAAHMGNCHKIGTPLGTNAPQNTPLHPTATSPNKGPVSAHQGLKRTLNQ